MALVALRIGKGEELQLQCWIGRRVQELRRHNVTVNRLSGFNALRHI